MSTWYTYEYSPRAFTRKIDSLFGWWLDDYPHGQYNLAPVVVSASVETIRQLAREIPARLGKYADFVQLGDAVDTRTMDVRRLANEKWQLKRSDKLGRPECLVYVATTPADLEPRNVVCFTERPFNFLPAIALIAGGAAERFRFTDNVVDTNSGKVTLVGNIIKVNS